ncbi:hypothetical protein HispidOSU_011563 [Sigmodon hispidus]
MEAVTSRVPNVTCEGSVQGGSGEPQISVRQEGPITTRARVLSSRRTRAARQEDMREDGSHLSSSIVQSQPPFVTKQQKADLLRFSSDVAFRRQEESLPLLTPFHNSGFYGHYRSQVKSESAGEYRLAAKPAPPAVFLQRFLGLEHGQEEAEQPPRQHYFSKHDNRTSFDKGIGRRKDLERLWKPHTFLRWAPCELELSQQPPLESSYQTDFRTGTGLSRLPQRLVHFVQVQPPYASTTYQHNFCRPSEVGRCGSAKLKMSQGPVTSLLPGSVSGSHGICTNVCVLGWGKAVQGALPLSEKA